MNSCAYLGCQARLDRLVRPGRPRLYCSQACKRRAARHVLPKTEEDRLVEAAREGANRMCIDCCEPPLGGGMRCYPCFKSFVDRKKTA